MITSRTSFRAAYVDHSSPPSSNRGIRLPKGPERKPVLAACCVRERQPNPLNDMDWEQRFMSAFDAFVKLERKYEETLEELRGERYRKSEPSRYLLGQTKTT